MLLPGDPDLNALPDVNSTNDACVLEFDVAVLADTLAFNYIFASEEYLEFVGTSYNDAFGFFISGPGIIGSQNIAIIPGTGIPVTINNVNPGSFASLYINNGDGFTAPFSVNPDYPQYDGATVVMQARAVVTPCQTYHLKLVVADEFDGILDSGVFIEAGSLSSFGVGLSSSTSVGFGFDNAIEGCVDGIITFTRTAVTSDDLVVAYEVGGTATNGLDYAAVGTAITIPGSAASADLVIAPIVDALPEGIETVTIYLLSECDGSRIDSVTLGIQDEILLDILVPEDTVICPGASLVLPASGGIAYSWSPGESLDDPLSPNPTATPDATTVYTVSTTLGTCTDSETITVTVAEELSPDAGADKIICYGESVVLSGSSSGTGLSYSWSPEVGLDNPDAANPTASPEASTVYTLTIKDLGGCTATDEVVVSVDPLPLVQASADSLVCPGTLVALSASGGVSYAWSPAEGLSDPTSPFPSYTAFEPAAFSVIITDANGCRDTAYVSVALEPFPSVNAGTDTLVFLGESVTLLGSGSGALQWLPPAGLSDPFAAEPTASPANTTWYYLTATSPIGCQSVDSVLLTVIFDPIVEFPNAFSPNGDGINDLFSVIVRGPVAVEAYRIYNRWGEIIFESNNPNSGWDGTYRGKAQETGTYVFHFLGLDPNGAGIERHGTLHLVR
jgi:gliding motility-associated-like protein